MEILIKCPHCEGHGSLVIGDDPAAVSCSLCDELLFDYEVVVDQSGFVYVLSNTAFAGLVKVGCTKRAVADRIQELNAQTGVPGDFVVEAYFQVDDPFEAERLGHERLESARVQGKEFFRVSVEEAVVALAEVLGGEPAYSRSGIIAKHPIQRGEGDRADKDADITRSERAQRLASWQARKLAK